MMKLRYPLLFLLLTACLILAFCAMQPEQPQHAEREREELERQRAASEARPAPPEP